MSKDATGGPGWRPRGTGHRAQAISAVMRRLERTEDNIKGLLPGMMSEAGFQEVQIVKQFMTVFGTIMVYRGVKPGGFKAKKDNR